MNLSLKSIADHGNRARRNNSEREKVNQMQKNTPDSSYCKVIRKRRTWEKI